MIFKDIMKYIESEYSIINYTPCKVCGGNYIIKCSNEILIDDIPYDICHCICSNCGYEKVFQFCAPFIKEDLPINIKAILN